MTASPAAAVLTFIALVVVAASVSAWLIATLKAARTWGWLPQSFASLADGKLAAQGFSPGLPLVAWNTRRLVPWALVDLILLMGIWLLASLAVSAVLRQLGWIEGAVEVETLSLDQRKALIAGNILVSLAIAGVGLPLVALRTGATLADFGWSGQQMLGDLRLGLIGFVMLAPPVYALQGLLVSFWQPSKHPLMEMFKGAPDAAFFILLCGSAALIAPLFEELIFRVQLQGFLEKACSFRGMAHELFFGALHHDEISVAELADGQGDVTLFSGQAMVAGNSLADSNPYIAPQAANQIAPTRAVDHQQAELRGASAWLPIAISSAIFALLHYSHGPDWIPLLVLSAGMGYLYQRTHRLLPSLTVHALLNAFSMWGLWVQVKDGAGG